MKFAEMTQEVQIIRPTQPKADIGLTPGRRKANQLFKMAVNNLEEMGNTDAKKLPIDLNLVYSLGPNINDIKLTNPESNHIIMEIMQLLEQRIEKRKMLLDDFNARRKFINYLFVCLLKKSIYHIFIIFDIIINLYFRVPINRSTISFTFITIGT